MMLMVHSSVAARLPSVSVALENAAREADGEEGRVVVYALGVGERGRGLWRSSLIWMVVGRLERG